MRKVDPIVGIFNFSQFYPLISNHGSKGQNGNNLTAKSATDPTILKVKSVVRCKRVLLLKAARKSHLRLIWGSAIQVFSKHSSR